MNHGRFFLAAGALSGLLTVAFGAFAAHGLRHQIPPEMLLVFNKGVLYQGLHALALLATGIMSTQHGSRALSIAGWSFLLGILLVQRQPLPSGNDRQPLAGHAHTIWRPVLPHRLAEPADSQQALFQTMSHKLLIIEDDASLSQMLTLHFEEQGFEVVAAFNCHSALQLAEQTQPDLILLDQQLPDGSRQ